MTRGYLFLLLPYFVYGSRDTHLGCYMTGSQIQESQPLSNNTDCSCRRYYYRYVNFYNGKCTCGNYLGKDLTNTTCSIHCSQNNCDPSIAISDVYMTGNMIPGPPQLLHIENITNSSCRILWKEPESFVNITGYVINATILKTFSKYPRPRLEWLYSHDTFQTEISTLFPSSTYNISIAAQSDEDNGIEAYQTIVTKIGDPDNIPPQPQIINHSGDKIIVKLSPTINNNGPVSAYQIIVVNSDDNQGFQGDNVLPYNEAKKQGYSYYIAAELNPEDINKEFVVGDGKQNGAYFNAPLDSDVNYNFVVALISNFNGETKVTYSKASGYNNGISILNVYDDEANGDPPGVIIGLSVAIGLLTFMLIAGIIGFIILKSKVVNRRQRLSETQELTLQGPVIEVENNGYIHEEEHIPAIKHYRNLKERVRTIPTNQLKIEPTNLLGIGRFGKVNSGTLHENDKLTTVTCYSIYDKKMNQETKRAMLQELDILIKTGKHDNILNLIGTSENSQMVVVIMEYASMNLKDLLLSSRDHLPGKFSSMSESQALEIAIGTCKGMTHLHSLNIIHKQLCARSVLISDGVPKIGSYGLAQFFSHNKIPDYTRWTALEVFKSHPHTSKSDTWSFACILWEICCLGGTPYGSISNNNEIPENIGKGVRLPQLNYLSDDLYQIMLDCWQLIPDERPSFSSLVDSLENLKTTPALCFNVYSSFQYEQFYPDMELSLRPVF